MNLAHKILLPIVILTMIVALMVTFAPASIEMIIPHDWDSQIGNSKTYDFPSPRIDGEDTACDYRVESDKITIIAQTSAGMRLFTLDSNQIVIESFGGDKYKYFLEPPPAIPIPVFPFTRATLEARVVRVEYEPISRVGHGSFPFMNNNYDLAIPSQEP